MVASMQLTIDQHTIGTKVWYYDSKSSDGWVGGTVTKAEGDKLLVTLENNETLKVSPKDCPLQNPSALGGVEVISLRGSSLSNNSFCLCSVPTPAFGNFESKGSILSDFNRHSGISVVQWQASVFQVSFAAVPMCRT
jgi:hypothetical protein